jgi:hypothetical protein
MFALMIDQHAPPLPLHSAPVLNHELERNAQSKSGGVIFQSKYRVAIVRMELKILLNKFNLNHPRTPTFVIGGFRFLLSILWEIACIN